jgi:hypothetical protein
MNLNPTSEITRRAALGAMAVLGATGLVAAGEKAPAETGRRPRKMTEVEAEYRRLRPLFEDERKQFAESSNTHDYWKGPHGKAIIALGPAVIPQLIQELRKGDFFFNVPLARITNADITNEKFGSEQDNARLWLTWWDGGKDRG